RAGTTSSYPTPTGNRAASASTGRPTPPAPARARPCRSQRSERIPPFERIPPLERIPPWWSSTRLHNGDEPPYRRGRSPGALTDSEGAWRRLRPLFPCLPVTLTDLRRRLAALPFSARVRDEAAALEPGRSLRLKGTVGSLPAFVLADLLERRGPLVALLAE